MFNDLTLYQFVVLAGGLVGIWIKHQNDYAVLKSRVKSLELKNDEITAMLKKLAEDVAEIKLLLARKQIDN